MSKEIQEGELLLKVSPQAASNPAQIEEELRRSLGFSKRTQLFYEVLKRSIDARKRPVYQLKIRWSTEAFESVNKLTELALKADDTKPVVQIIGAGPAGLFAAVELLRNGFRPVILERGKIVRDRRRDLAQLTREHKVHPDSNYCFGEGGAGTYSDGKLYTRSGKRGSIREVLEWLVHFGAEKDILIDAHPHIGTNKLPQLIENMRDAIETAGGEYRFSSRIDGFKKEGNKIAQLVSGDKEWEATDVILATGHSARNIFEMLAAEGIEIEAKEFAVGLRVEHPQSFIDRQQYGQEDRGKYLPPASYHIRTKSKERGVYSFCMCPGGIIAPCATADGEIVTNGWSPSKRNNKFANSGIVVQVLKEDWEAQGFTGPLAALHFQQSIEKAACVATGGQQSAPAAFLKDFVEGRTSTGEFDCSYLPNVKACDFSAFLPPFLLERLQAAFLDFNEKMPGYISNKAIVVGPESRTSSPVRIPRDRESFQHITIENLYPCGEGAGYAGGIVSAAIDGINVARAIIKKHESN